MKEKIKNIITNFFNKIKNTVTTSYEKCKNGDEKLNNLLIYWSLIPCIIYLFIRYKISFPNIILNIIDLFMLFFTILNLYFIQKAIKIHPEYDTKATKELEKIKYYATLNEEEYKKAIEKDKKEKGKKFIKGIFSINNSDGVDFYKIVRMFVILTLVIVLKILFF